MRTPKDLSGQTFARWTVLRPVWPDGVHVRWECRCACGTVRALDGWTLKAGKSRSCGCLGNEETRARLVTHGMTKHPLFRHWQNMLTRCRNPNRTQWKDYGGRGIAVCERWLEFANFYEDMGASWSPGLTIERDDNDKGYEPGNCRWLERPLQSRNRRSCIYLDTPKGRMTVSEAARAYGLKFATLRARIERGWPPHLLYSPAGPKGTNATHRLDRG